MLNNTGIMLVCNYKPGIPMGKGQDVTRDFRGELFGCRGEKGGLSVKRS